MSNNMKTYEGMFLIDAGNPDFQAASEPITNVLNRTEAEVLSLKPWDERKLAYEIKGRKRGLYVLSYFKVDPLRVAEIEHECELDERVLRVLILRQDNVSDETVAAETPATAAAARMQEAAAKREADEAAAAAQADDKADKVDKEAPAEAPAPADKAEEGDAAAEAPAADASAKEAPAGEPAQPEASEEVTTEPKE